MFADRRSTPLRQVAHLHLLAALLAGCATVGASAQTLTLQLLNAKNGKPLPNRNLTFHWGDTKQTTVVLVNANGVAQVNVPPGTTDFIVVEGSHSGKETNHLAVEDCNENSSTSIRVADVLSRGIAPRNTCSTRSTPPHPGEIIFWARVPSHWSPSFQ